LFLYRRHKLQLIADRDTFATRERYAGLHKPRYLQLAQPYGFQNHPEALVKPESTRVIVGGDHTQPLLRGARHHIGKR
jgi:hypothetical protein